MDPQIAHASVFAVLFHLALPVDGLFGIHIAGMTEGRTHLDDFSEGVRADPADQFLASRVIGELAGAADDQLRMLFDGGQNAVVRGFVDAEGLFTQQMLARFQNVDIDFFVQKMGDRRVDRVDPGIGQKIPVVFGADPDGGEIVAEPVSRRGVWIGDADDFGLRDPGGKLTPSGGGAGELPAHQPASDHPEADRFFHGLSLLRTGRQAGTRPLPFLQNYNAAKMRCQSFSRRKRPFAGDASLYIAAPA